MPSACPHVRAGLYSDVITPYYARVLLLMRQYRDTQVVGRICDVQREGIAMIVRVVEHKLDTKLFKRRRGYSIWTLFNTPAATEAWKRLIDIDHQHNQQAA